MSGATHGAREPRQKKGEVVNTPTLAPPHRRLRVFHHAPIVHRLSRVPKAVGVRGDPVADGPPPTRPATFFDGELLALCQAARERACRRAEALFTPVADFAAGRRGPALSPRPGTPPRPRRAPASTNRGPVRSPTATSTPGANGVGGGRTARAPGPGARVGATRRQRTGPHGQPPRRPGRDLFRLPHSQFSKESPGTFETWRVLFVTRVHLSATA